jgi:hypothetical protein
MNLLYSTHRGRDNDHYILGYIFGQKRFDENSFQITIFDSDMNNYNFLLNRLLNSEISVSTLETKDGKTVITASDEKILDDLKNIEKNTSDVLLFNINTLRGWIDGSRMINFDKNRCRLTISHPFVKELLAFTCKFRYEMVFEGVYEWKDYFAIDWIGYIYESKFFYSKYNYQKYQEMIKYVSPTYEAQPIIEYKKIQKDSINPNKDKMSSPYINIFFIRRMKDDEYDSTYDSGIYLKIPAGFYLEILDTPFMISSGYMVSNGVCLPGTEGMVTPIVTMHRIHTGSNSITLPFSLRAILRRNDFPVIREII